MPGEERYDVAIIGAGPAGLACTAEAISGGLHVALVDQQPRMGGAYWRHSTAHARAQRPAALHHGWDTFTRLRERVTAATHLPEHAVWAIEPTGTAYDIHALVGERDRRAHTITATRVVIAAGSHDRVVPFAGWTLPGVMTAGGAQALLKGSLFAVGPRVLVAGTGPLLLVVAAGLVQAGVDVVAVVESGHPLGYALSPHGWRGALARSGEGARYIATLAKHRVPYLAGWQVVAAHGDSRVKTVEISNARGRTKSYETDALLVSYGFTPAMELLLQLETDCRLDDDGSLVAVVDEGQRTSVPGVLAAGEVTGVGGAALAVLEGYVAGRTLAEAPVDMAILRRISMHRGFAKSMHRIHHVSDNWVARLPDSTLVCRCEEVSAGHIRAAAAELEARDSRTVKLLTRAGMGLCQGRTCGRAVAELIAEQPQVNERVRSGARTPAQPIPLSVLADRADGKR